MLYIIVGKSASGKDTLLQKFVGAGILPLVSYTTRPMRENEKDGIDYHFVNDREFSSLISKGVFFEYRSYKASPRGEEAIWWYGSPYVNIKDNNYVVVLDIEGAMSYLKHYSGKDIEIIWLDVSDEVRKQRAKKRGSFDETEWNRRCIDDASKFEIMDELMKMSDCPIIKINNNFQEALDMFFENYRKEKYESFY